MTDKELKQIYYLNKEVRMWQNELSRLECKSLIKGQELTGMPFTGGTSDKTGDLATEIVETRTIINGKLAEIQVQRKNIMRFIDSIDDSLLRQIFFYRCVSCMSWYSVAENIGGNNTSESVKKQYQRYLKRYPTCPE